MRCRASSRLPEDCFCWDGVCSHPYTTYYTILTSLLTIGQDSLVELEGNLLGWSVVTGEMNITARLSLQPHNILFPLEITVEKFGRIMSNSKQDHIRIRYSTIQFQPADKLTLHQHLQNREKVNVFELQPPPGTFTFHLYLNCKLHQIISETV